jgi:cardiolipin synthase
MAEPLLTVANQLTILRMALCPFLVVMVLAREFTWALVIFVVAAVTDLLDGFLARRGHQETTLGATMDPIADKMLMAASYVALTWGAGVPIRLPVWLTVITLSRDAIIVLTVAVVNLTLGRRVFYPSILGKLSTMLQLVTAGVVLALNAAGHAFPLVHWLFLATVVLTVSSALHYVYLASVTRPSGASA